MAWISPLSKASRPNFAVSNILMLDSNFLTLEDMSSNDTDDDGVTDLVFRLDRLERVILKKSRQSRGLTAYQS
jgi:hypothetical protein